MREHVDRGNKTDQLVVSRRLPVELLETIEQVAVEELRVQTRECCWPREKVDADLPFTECKQGSRLSRDEGERPRRPASASSRVR